MYLTVVPLTWSVLASMANACERVALRAVRWLAPPTSTFVCRRVATAVAELTTLKTTDAYAKTASATCAVAPAVGTPTVAALLNTATVTTPRKRDPMSIDAKLDALIAAINANTAALNARLTANVPPAGSSETPPARRTRAADAPPKSDAPKAVTKQDVIDAMREFPRDVTAALLKRFSPDGKMSGVPVEKYGELLAAALAEANKGGAEAADPLLG